MSPKPPNDIQQLTVEVSDYAITVSYRGRTVLSMGIDNNGTVCASAPMFDDINWADVWAEAMARLNPLQVQVSYEDRGTQPTSIPRRVTELIEPARRIISTSPSTSSRIPPNKTVSTSRTASTSSSVHRHRVVDTSVDRINEESRDEVLEDILQSLIDEPDQTTERRVEITRHIADKHGVRFYAVAGVRAALTKGVYGDMEWLLRQRRKPKIGKANTE